MVRISTSSPTTVSGEFEAKVNNQNSDVWPATP
jgi:hypothetical protein